MHHLLRYRSRAAPRRHAATAAELARGAIYSVVELTFRARPKSRPTRPRATSSCGLGSVTRAVSRSIVFLVTTTATAKAAWPEMSSRSDFVRPSPADGLLAEVKSNARELDGQHRGATITATPPHTAKGFWLVDSASPGKRWYQRSNGAHDYIVGNTMYSFLSETYYGRPA